MYKLVLVVIENAMEHLFFCPFVACEKKLASFKCKTIWFLLHFQKSKIYFCRDEFVSRKIIEKHCIETEGISLLKFWARHLIQINQMGNMYDTYEYCMAAIPLSWPMCAQTVFVIAFVQMITLLFQWHKESSHYSSEINAYSNKHELNMENVIAASIHC